MEMTTQEKTALRLIEVLVSAHPAKGNPSMMDPEQALHTMALGFAGMLLKADPGERAYWLALFATRVVEHIAALEEFDANQTEH